MGRECEGAAIEGPLTRFGNAKTDSAVPSETQGIVVEARRGRCWFDRTLWRGGRVASSRRLREQGHRSIVVAVVVNEQMRECKYARRGIRRASTRWKVRSVVGGTTTHAFHVQQAARRRVEMELDDGGGACAVVSADGDRPGSID